jgi:NTP pyrophosphatase (non-canonical NTP hydrolase)
MSRQANQSTQWDYKVNQVKLVVEGSNKFSGLYANQREDTGEVLGATSEQYGLIQNKDLINAANEALEAKGLNDYEQKIIVTGGGQRMFAEFTFKNRQLANEVGDIFGYKLILKNSFDRSLRASFELGWERLVCKNGMSTMEKEFSATRKHSTKISTEFLVGAIENALASGPNSLKVYDAMAAIAITDEQGINVLGHLEAKGMLSGSLKESIVTLWLHPTRQEDKARNLYNLYNAVTEHLSRQVEGERYEYAHKVNNNVLFSLVNASRKPEALSKLIIPVPQDKGTVMVATGPVLDVDVVAA